MKRLEPILKILFWILVVFLIFFIYTKSKFLIKQSNDNTYKIYSEYNIRKLKFENNIKSETNKEEIKYEVKNELKHKENKKEEIQNKKEEIKKFENNIKSETNKEKIKYEVKNELKHKENKKEKMQNKKQEIKKFENKEKNNDEEIEKILKENLESAKKKLNQKK